MTHNLSFDASGEAMMAYVGETPWTRLGQRVEGLAMTAREAIKAGHLDWEVFAGETFLKVNGQDWPTGAYSTYRMEGEKVIRLGNGGGKFWTPVQNRDLFSFFDGVVEDGDAIYHTVGALGRGERVWVLAKLPKSCFVVRLNGKEDLHECYVLLSNSHEPGSSYKILLTTVRVVCQNTHAAALDENKRNKRGYTSLAHTSKVILHAEDAKAQLGIVNRRIQETSELLAALARKSVSADTLGDLFAKVYPLPEGNSQGTKARRDIALSNRSLAEKLFSTGVGQEFAPGTLYAAYNAVTELSTHFIGRRDAEGQFKHVTDGAGADASGRALALVADML